MPYHVAVYPTHDLTDAELDQCLTVIRAGEAIRLPNTATLRHQCQLIATARDEAAIIGIYAIKRARPAIARWIMTNAAAKFNPTTPELGYAAIAPTHRGRDLSTILRATIMAAHHGPLYAVTSHPASIHGLGRAGFTQIGQPWRGQRGDSLRLFTYAPA